MTRFLSSEVSDADLRANQPEGLRGTDMVLCLMTYLAADQLADGMLAFGVLVCQERLEHTPKPEKALQSPTCVRHVCNVMTWI